MAGSKQYTRAILAFMVALAIFLICLDAVIISRERRILYAEFNKQAQNEFTLIETFVTEPLLQEQFTIVELFMMQWGEKKTDIIELRAFSPQGLLLAEFKRPSPENETVIFRHSVLFRDKHLLDLEITKDLIPISSRIQRFWKHLILQSLVVTVALGIVLWVILRSQVLRPLEAEIARRRQAEKELQKSKDQLEDRVAERTKKLQKASQQLRAGEERYREIYNTPSDAIFMHDADTGKILDVNKGMLDMYGYTYEQALQVDIGSLSSSESPYSMEEARKKIQHTIMHGPQTFEWVAKKKDGTLFWTEVSLKHTEFSGNRYVVAVVRDINARKQAEETLAEEKERLAVTLRSIGDGVITSDVAGNVVMLNKIAEELTGWSQADAVGRPLVEIFHIINEQTREQCENPVSKVLSSGDIIELANHTVLIAKDGTKRSIADSGAPIRDRDSHIMGVVLVFRDVTEQIKTEKELLKSKKIESIGVLAGGIAHDFNNILAAILGNINLALFDEDLKDGTKILLSEAEKASLRAKDLTQQLLTFSKGGEPVKEVASLDSVIRDSANFVLHGDTVACKFDIPDNLWLVNIDKGQISQVIQNIILNASHAMPEGGIVTVTCENVSSGDNSNGPVLPKGRFVKISLRDNGIGMPMAVIDKIFDPYFSTKQEGSGLGLAITHSIISKHDGQISVESSPGVGTTFTLYLPASEFEDIKMQKSEEHRATSSQAKIMVMDDEKMVRNVAQAMLIQLGHEVALVADGAAAVKLYQKSMASDKLFDLVIMDLTIPGGMGGEEAVQKMLNIDPKVKVIVSSGYSNDPIMANFEDYGFCAAIVKPYQLQVLSKVISQLID